MSLYKDIKEHLKESEETPCADPVERERRIKEVYLMDRVLRGMNDEDGLYDSGWLYNVADEDSDYGFDEFKERSLKYNGDDPYYEHSEPDYYYTDEEMYNHLVELYKEIIKEYGEAGFLTRKYYENHPGNWKDNAGLDDEQIEFLKKDLPDAKLFTEGDK